MMSHTNRNKNCLEQNAASCTHEKQLRNNIIHVFSIVYNWLYLVFYLDNLSDYFSVKV
jgi:cytochrome c oxidase subunit IV